MVAGLFLDTFFNAHVYSFALFVFFAVAGYNFNDEILKIL